MLCKANSDTEDTNEKFKTLLCHDNIFCYFKCVLKGNKKIEFEIPLFQNPFFCLPCQSFGLITIISDG